MALSSWHLSCITSAFRARTLARSPRRRGVLLMPSWPFGPSDSFFLFLSPLGLLVSLFLLLLAMCLLPSNTPLLCLSFFILESFFVFVFDTCHSSSPVRSAGLCALPGRYLCCRELWCVTLCLILLRDNRTAFMAFAPWNVSVRGACLCVARRCILAVLCVFCRHCLGCGLLLFVRPPGRPSGAGRTGSALTFLADIDNEPSVTWHLSLSSFFDLFSFRLSFPTYIIASPSQLLGNFKFVLDVREKHQDKDKDSLAQCTLWVVAGCRRWTPLRASSSLLLLLLLLQIQ